MKIKFKVRSQFNSKAFLMFGDSRRSSSKQTNIFSQNKQNSALPEAALIPKNKANIMPTKFCNENSYSGSVKSLEDKEQVYTPPKILRTTETFRMKQPSLCQ